MAMDPKTLMRARMREAQQRREKRIDSPLVRYNDVGQAVCKICNVAIKLESLWPAHLGSRQHKEAAEAFKARAKVAKADEKSVQQTLQDGNRPAESPSLPSAAPTENDAAQASKRARKETALEESVTPEAKSGALPQGFFDSADADLKARGLQIPKNNIEDELKEFEKAIKDDLEDVDVRLEEEEFDAAEEREEREEFEQILRLERIEMFKKMKQERIASTAAAASVVAALADGDGDGGGGGGGGDGDGEGEGEDEDEDEDDEDDLCVIDWRAQQI